MLFPINITAAHAFNCRNRKSITGISNLHHTKSNLPYIAYCAVLFFLSAENLHILQWRRKRGAIHNIVHEAYGVIQVICLLFDWCFASYSIMFRLYDGVQHYESQQPNRVREKPMQFADYWKTFSHKVGEETWAGLDLPATDWSEAHRSSRCSIALNGWAMDLTARQYNWSESVLR